MYRLVLEKKYFVLGENCSIDSSSVIGEMPQRKIKNPHLTIGRDSIIRSHSVIYRGSTIGDHFNTGHSVVVREENRIEENVSVWSGSIIDYGCRIGSGTKIHSLVYICQFTDIEEDVFLAPGVITGNDLHPGCEKSRECLKGPTIKKGAQIGLNATILPYVTIGEKVLIGAGSVVTHDIPAGKLAYGVPAKVICDIGEIRCIHQPPYVKKPYPE